MESVAALVMPSAVRAVVFDVGETLLDETWAWGVLADQVGATHLTMFAALGALIERGEDHRLLWGVLGVERPTDFVPIEPGDFYPDALPCLQAVRDAGYIVGLAGNQPTAAEVALETLGLPVDFVATSESWGVEKPSPAFFERISIELELPAEHIAYIGDRLDNDALPAKAAGMFAVFIRRGPWGYLHAHLPDVAKADARIESLSELTAMVAKRDRENAEDMSTCHSSGFTKSERA